MCVFICLYSYACICLYSYAFFKYVNKYINEQIKPYIYI